MPKYSELLRDPRWQKKRLGILQRDEFTCQKCGSTEKTLHVHHCYYERDKMPWDYPDASLLTLCYECHEEETEVYGKAYAAHALLRDFATIGLTASDMEQFSYAFFCGRDFPRKRIQFKRLLSRIFEDEAFYNACLSLQGVGHGQD